MNYVEHRKSCQPGLRRVFDFLGLGILGFDTLADTVLPWRCVVCGMACGRPGICVPCKKGLPWNIRACTLCGLPLSTDVDSHCGACLRKSPVFDAVMSPLLFKFPVNRLVHQFKFNRDLAAGSVFGSILAEYLADSTAPRPTLLVPVPMHRFRLISRCLNPAYELARQLGHQLDIPVSVHGLQRHRHTRTQTGLDAKSRRRNLKGAFRWRGVGLKHKRIALVDDVMTTGSTMAACTRELKRCGAQNVVAWTVARAVR